MGYIMHWKVVERLGMEARVGIKAIEAEGRWVWCSTLVTAGSACLCLV